MATVASPGAAPIRPAPVAATTAAAAGSSRPTSAASAAPSASAAPPSASAKPPTTPAVAAVTLRLPTVNAVPFSRGPDYTFKARSGAPKFSPFSRGFPFTRFAPDGNTALLASGRAAELRVGSARGVKLRDTSAYRSDFSPDLKRLATADEDGTLTIWSVPSGEEQLRLGAAFKAFGSAGSGKYIGQELAFSDNTHVLYHTGCRLRRLDIETEQSQTVSPADLCGYITVSENGKRWIVADERFVQGCGLGRCYARGVWLDAQTGLGTEFVRGPFTDTRLSPDGNRYCFARPGQQLSCVDLERAQEDRIATDRVDRWYDFDAASNRLFFATEADKEKLLFVADFATRSVRFIARLSYLFDRWYALAPDRLLVEGHDGAVLFDLARGFSQQIMPRGTEVEGFAVIPGSPRFILGKAGGPRSYVEVAP
ncbi:MAG TPA: hypothetical protein VHP33_33085 [Polyangiaceae bacterium]|nr:hypothetical protein [Polyangiaceae bacterium]